MINIAEILKDVPEGTELWCTLYGKVKFISVNSNEHYPIKVRLNDTTIEKFDKYGRYYDHFEESECILFPSKGKTWENWKLPSKPNFKMGNWIVYKDGGTFCGGLKTVQVKTVEKDYYIFTQNTNGSHRFIDSECRLWSIKDAQDGDVLVDKYGNVGIYEEMSGLQWYSHIYFGCDGHLHGFEAGGCHSQKNTKPATSEQRDLLFAKMKEAGYEWDVDNKELKKVQPHYDIANLKPFDKILGRNCCRSGVWRADYFSHIHKNGKLFVGIGYTWEQCIPFNEKTKHLLGTNDPCGEEYINWKT